MNRREIKKKRVVFKIEIGAPRGEKYKIGAAVQILETIRFFHFTTIHLREVSQICDDSFTRGQPPISVAGHWRILSYALDTIILLFEYLTENKIR